MKNPAKVTVLALAIGLFLVGVLLQSCTVQAEASIAVDRSAKIVIQAQIHPVMQAYLKDLAGVAKDSGQDSEIISATKIRQRLAQEKGVSVQKVEASLQSGINITLQVADIQQLFVGKSSDVKRVFSIGQNGDATRLTLRLDRAAVESFMAMGMSKEDGDVKSLLPQDPKIGAKQYQDQLAWAFEDYGSKDQLATMFKNAKLKLKLTLPRPIISQTGFVVVNKAAGQVELELPILEVLTLQKVLNYEVQY